MRLRAVIFDVDGTLLDSQADIMGAMGTAFGQLDLQMPPRAEIMARVGLSLDVFFTDLLPEASTQTCAALSAAYKKAFAVQRQSQSRSEAAPLYPGAREASQRLQRHDTLLLGVATGKSKRGLDAMIDAHGLQGVFATRQVADTHPSKPHPAMLLAAVDALGVAPEDAVMVGDTEFDLQMARAANTAFIAVPWGYHDVSRLAGADAVLESFEALDGVLDRLWRSDDG